MSVNGLNGHNGLDGRNILHGSRLTTNVILPGAQDPAASPSRRLAQTCHSLFLVARNPQHFCIRDLPHAATPVQQH